MHVVRVKQVSLYDIQAKQASRYNVVHAIETVAAQSADCMACTLRDVDMNKFILSFQKLKKKLLD